VQPGAQASLPAERGHPCPDSAHSALKFFPKGARLSRKEFSIANFLSRCVLKPAEYLRSRHPDLLLKSKLIPHENSVGPISFFLAPAGFALRLGVKQVSKNEFLSRRRVEAKGAKGNWDSTETR
jgi:hypothetical protein